MNTRQNWLVAGALTLTLAHGAFAAKTQDAAPQQPMPGQAMPGQMMPGQMMPRRAMPMMTPLSQDDREFLEMVTRGNRAEMEMGEMVSKWGRQAETRWVAENIRRDHEMAQRDLEGLAGLYTMTAPADMGQDLRFKTERLGRMSGNGLDVTFLEDQIEMHEKMIDSFLRRMRETQSMEVREFTKRHLPSLMAHAMDLKNAKHIAKTRRW